MNTTIIATRTIQRGMMYKVIFSKKGSKVRRSVWVKASDELDAISKANTLYPYEIVINNVINKI